MNKIFCVLGLCLLTSAAALAVEVTGTTSVNVTSDTAASAKTRAFNSARREVILRELGEYADKKQLETAVNDSSNDELMNIISSSSVASEKVSDTTYTANISFVIDGDAARKWMEKYSVQNWLPATGAVAVVVPENSILINANLLRPMTDWMALNGVARSVNVDVATRKIVGNMVSFTVTEKEFTKLSNALKTNGWNVQKFDDGYKIWK
ncbi:MAG: hypothetical protein J5608_02645 [Alphaproteobacteria bacterium]|nr:hypothetical protein [Alphaproteobacteria bacterium]